MNINALVNKDGGVVLAISPENDMEKEILKSLMKQDNMIHEVRGSLSIFNHPIRDSILIASKTTNLVDTKTDD